MTWVRLDDHFDEHPKLAQVGPLGIALWATGLAYCNRNSTRGHIPWTVARGLVQWQFLGEVEADGRRRVYQIGVSCGMVGEDATAEFVIKLLLDAGLWEEVDNGYQVHDYADYQPLPEDIEARRQMRAEAGRLGGLATQANRGAPPSNGQATAEALAQASASANKKQTLQQKSSPYPVPVPVPVPEPGPETGPEYAPPTPPAGGVATTAATLSEEARAVIEAWRIAHGKRRPPRFNPTQTAALETAVQELGVARLQEAAVYTARKGLAEFHKCITSAYTKRQQDEAAEAYHAPGVPLALPPRDPASYAHSPAVEYHRRLQAAADERIAAMEAAGEEVTWPQRRAIQIQIADEWKVAARARGP